MLTNPSHKESIINQLKREESINKEKLTQVLGEINQFRFSPHNTIQINSTCIRAKCKEKQNPKQNTIKIRRYLFLTIR